MWGHDWIALREAGCGEGLVEYLLGQRVRPRSCVKVLLLCACGPAHEWQRQGLGLGVHTRTSKRNKGLKEKGLGLGQY